MPGLPPPTVTPARLSPAGRRRATYTRVLPISLLVSVGIHAFALSVGFHVEFGDDEQRSPGRPTPRSPSGTTRLVNLGARTGRPARNSADPVLQEPAPRRADQPAGNRRTAEPTGEPPQAPVASLRPRLIDPRLWPVRLPTEPDPTLPETARLSARTDSVRRVGPPALSVRLLGTTLSLCSAGVDSADCGFGVAPWRRDAYRAERDMRLGLERQGRRADLVDRERAIRVRLDSLRDTLPPIGNPGDPGS